MKVELVIKEDKDEDTQKTDEFIRTIYTQFPNTKWAGKGPGVYTIHF